jgi:hypothetical protein
VQKLHAPSIYQECQNTSLTLHRETITGRRKEKGATQPANRSGLTAAPLVKRGMVRTHTANGVEKEEIGKSARSATDEEN